MNYKVLSQADTDIWLSNLDKAINQLEAISNSWDIRLQKMTEQYREKYYTGWRKIWHAEPNFWIHYKGHACPMGSFFKCKDVTPLNEDEIRLYNFVSDEVPDRLMNYKRVQERWAKYAKQPFEVNESDIVFYQNMRAYHHTAQVIAKNVGTENETFNMDEDSQYRS